MSKTAALASSQEAEYKVQAEHYLAETQKVLRGLAVERQRVAKRSRPPANLVEQVKKILYGV